MKYLLLPFCLSTFTSQASVQLFHQSVGTTDIAALKSMLKDDWQQAPTADASTGFVHQQYGIRWQADNHWQLQFAKRLTGTVKTDAATAAAYYQLANRQALPTAVDIPVQLQFRTIEATGLSLAYQWQYADWHYQVRLSRWSAQRYRESTVDGTLNGGKEGAILGLLNFHEYYSHSNFLKRPFQSGDWQQQGKGYSADLHLRGQLSSQWWLQLDLQDLYAEIQFEQLGVTQGQINSQNSYLNDAGYLEFIPVLQGKEFSEPRTQSLPKQYSLTSGWQMNADQQLLLQLKRLDQNNQWQLGFSHQWQQRELQFWLDPIHRLPGLLFKQQAWLIELAADKSSVSELKQFRLNLQIPIWF